MNAQLTAYITLICVSGVLNLYLCLYVFIKRHNYTNIARFFIVYALSIAIYCFGSAFCLMATTFQQIKYWTIILYIGLAFAPLLGLLFIMQYLGIHVSKKMYIALFTIPFISFIMVATNDLHHLFYREFKIDPILGAPYVYEKIGIWYMIHGVFIFSCMFVAFLLALSRWRETAKVYRPQLIALMFGQFISIITAFLYLIGVTPTGIDPVPMVLWVSSLLYLWAINSSRMFTITPIAKNAIFNSINDGVIVLDESYRLIEYNKACKSMFPKINRSMFGADFEKVWFGISGRKIPSNLEPAMVNQEMELTTGRIYQVRTSLLQHQNDSKGLLIIFTDITELKRLQLELEYQAYYDELTQIFNRRAFFQKCERLFHEAMKSSLPFTTILIDIDYFKKVNDTYGHDVGDQVLKHVAQVCQMQVGKDILFARYGGEEFILALKHNASVGESLANQLRQQVESQPLTTSEGVVAVTLSSGVAEAVKQPGETLNHLLNKADKALYVAKREGRNQVCVYAGVENG